MRKANHLTQSRVTSSHLQSSQTIFIITTLMLSTHLLLSFPSIPYRIKILHIFLASPIITMCPGLISLLNFNIIIITITIISYLYKSRSTSLYNILRFAPTSSFLRLNIFLRILLQNKLYSSFKVIKLYYFNL
jgi:hypothetical protein